MSHADRERWSAQDQYRAWQGSVRQAVAIADL
jgi:hypothetical protein